MVKPVFFYNFGVFMLKMLIMYVICLSRLLGIHLSLKRLVMFLDIHSIILVHFILGLIMLLSGVICVNIFSMILFRVFITHAMLNLTLFHPGTILMLS